MARILTDSDDELDVKFNINKNYADKYDNWRRKEELQKFKDRYGKDVLERGEEESSSSSDDDENAADVPEEFDKEFYHTLSCLKSKNPKIYDKSIKFFENIEPPLKASGSKSEAKSKPMFLRDYERKFIQEGGILSDEDEEPEEKVRGKAQSPSYFDEQDAIKESFKEVFHTAEDNFKEEQGIGGLFSKKIKSHQELEKEDDEYADWLRGNKGALEDVEEENKLSHLRSYWTDPALDPEEVFLRDYILQKKFKPQAKKEGKCLNKREEDKEDEDSYSDDAAPDGDLVEQEEKEIETMEEFEHKFNFRFEEPDQEFIKHYPRTLDHSLRKKDDRRKQKRDELRTRKEVEKQKLKEHLGKAKELKQKEIEERLKQLCSITGNSNIGFKGNDLDEDFDPEEHDRRMKEIFSEDAFYTTEENEKPKFPLLDEELDVEEWDTWGVDEAHEDGTVNQKHSGYVHDSLHSEDPNFNMDCDYDPNKSFEQEMLAACQKKSKGERGKGRRWRARQSRLAMGLLKEKPKFDPIAILSKAKLGKGDSATAFEKYVDEYYGLEYEDVIGGDLPCRFKYRKVIPNDFGLSVEEILNADDKELNRWCSLKKAVQIRPEENEKYDLQAYRKKSSNLNLKKKVFRSLFSSPEESNPSEEYSENKKCKIVKGKNEISEDNLAFQSDGLGGSEKQVVDDAVTVREAGRKEEAPLGEGTKKKKKKRKRNKSGKIALPQVEPVIRRKKSAQKTVVEEEIKNEGCEVNVKGMVVNAGSGKERGVKKKYENSHKKRRKETGVKHGKIKKQHDPATYLSGLTSLRLKAYGINPKRFGNKLKYKKSV